MELGKQKGETKNQMEGTHNLLAIYLFLLTILGVISIFVGRYEYLILIFVGFILIFVAFWVTSQ